jgi:adenosine deaminase CECR1
LLTHTPADRSRLSHDFYQIIAGKSDMTLHGLRQLIEWSIQHSCMEPKLMEEVRQSWEQKWKEFCEWIIKKDFTTKPASMKAQTDLETNKPPGGSPPV